VGKVSSRVENIAGRKRGGDVTLLAMVNEITFETYRYLRGLNMFKHLSTRSHWLGGILLLFVLFVAVMPFHAAENSLTETAESPQNDPLLETARIANSTEKSKPIRILVIGAHPADVFDQSGGTMAHHVQRGDWVGCLVVTTGVRTHDKVISDEMQRRKEIPDAAELNKTISERANVKVKEVVRACSILGVREQDIHFLGADDVALLVNQPMIRQLASYIRKLRPNVILTHYPYESGGIGSTHATTGQMVVHAISLAGGVDPGDKAPPHKVAQVFFFGQGAAAQRAHLWGAQGGFSNDVFVDITDVAEKKIACLDAMESQGYGGAYARKRIETSDGAFGSRVRVPYAEGFISLYSTTQYYLPISAIDLQHSKASDHEGIARRSYRVNVP
jgi:4-oxalomesaconate hydratase